MEDFQRKRRKKKERTFREDVSRKKREAKKENRKKNKSQSFGINSVDWDFYYAEEIIVNFSKFLKDNLRVS